MGVPEVNNLLIDAKLDSYLVIHITCDPLSNYQCDNNCDIFNKNEVCIATPTGYKKQDETCVPASITNRTVVAGDALVYLNMAFDLKANLKVLGEDDSQLLSTGGWIGPYTVLAPDGGNTSNTTKLLYSNAQATTQFLTPPYHYNITLDPLDFDRILGVAAQTSTIAVQGEGKEFMKDPFKKYKSTCENGDVKPLLPLLQFEKGIDDESGNKTMSIKVDWHLFSYPKKGTPMREKVFPFLMNNGFPVTGPYCYNNDPEEGYAFDFSFNSAHMSKIYSKADFTLNAGCDKGIPCQPELFEKCENCNLATTHVDNPSESQWNTILLLILISILLGVVVVGMSCCMCCMRRKHLNGLKQKENELANVIGNSNNIYVGGGGADAGAGGGKNGEEERNGDGDGEEDNLNVRLLSS